MTTVGGDRSFGSAGVWVLLVVVVGVGLGTLLALTLPGPPAGPPSGPGAGPIPPHALNVAMVVLSSVSIALLLALLVVYGRTYRTTRAPFVLGLWVFLLALLLESILSSPLLFTAFGVGPGSLGRFLTFGQLLMCVALTIFLYLSLE